LKPSVVEWSEEYFNNHALFSDDFVKERLPDPILYRDHPIDIVLNVDFAPIFSSPFALRLSLELLQFPVIRGISPNRQDWPARLIS
jgi:hypothetical protein